MAAEIDTSVLLIDADVVQPDLMRRLGVPTDKGLIDLLTDPALDVADVMLKTNVPKLSLLGAGSRDARSTELLASDAMAVLLDELASRYADRVIVFDAPPLLMTTEARVLASRMGQVVVVVEAGGTPRQAIEQAFASVSQCPIVMSLLNKSTDRSSHGYGYGYGYGYGDQ
jgi:receptor protein-tyrosine kinase